jgi:uncharacterized membrane protein
MAAPLPPERTRQPTTTRPPPDRATRTLLFNVTFFGTLACLASAARAADVDDWWHRFGQLPLVLSALILFWLGWWHVDKGRDREAVTLFVPGVAILSVWLTSVHGSAL